MSVPVVSFGRYVASRAPIPSDPMQGFVSGLFDSCAEELPLEDEDSVGRTESLSVEKNRMRDSITRVLGMGIVKLAPA